MKLVKDTDRKIIETNKVSDKEVYKDQPNPTKI